MDKDCSCASKLQNTTMTELSLASCIYGRSLIFFRSKSAARIVKLSIEMPHEC